MVDSKEETIFSGWHFSGIIKDIIRKTTGLELLEGKHSAEENKLFGAQISGIVLIAGEKNVMISISMPYKTASILVAYMAGLQYSEIKPEDIYDGITEITNMIAGQTKAMLVSSGHHYVYMQPFTVTGENLSIIQKNRMNSMIKRFHSGEVEIIASIYYQ